MYGFQQKILNQNHARHRPFAFMITSTTVCIRTVSEVRIELH